MELQVENLCKSYGTEAVLQNVTFTLKQGITCLTAPSGGGKTTLLRILMGLEKPDKGSISGLQQTRISVVFQEDRLLTAVGAEENLRFVLGEGYDSKQASMRLQELGLTVDLKKPVRDYSGGMKRRLALCRALLVPSELLLLDEPFTGLDLENRKRAFRCIQKYGENRMVLLVTHDLSDGQLPGIRTITLEAGKMVASEWNGI